MTRILERSVETDTATAIGPAIGAKQPIRPAARTFRPDIEGLRAFAVLAVVLYHAHLFGVRGGFVGVDVFFVISGFLITRQLADSVGRRGIRALPTFYTHRIRRLLPASAVVVIATVIVARFVAPALQVRSIAIDSLYTTFYSLNYRLAAAGTQYLHQTDSVSPLQHFWSLGVEEQFYLGWPAIIALVALVGTRLRRPLLALVLLAVTVASFYYCVRVTGSSAPWAYFSLLSRAWELALGGLVAIGAGLLVRLPGWLSQLAASTGLLAVIGSAFLYSDATRYPGTAAALPVVGTAMLIAAGCGPRRRVERLLAEPVLQCIGKISYSWYLWHWPMLILAPMVTGYQLDPLSRLIVVLASMTAAIGSYFLVENPLRGWRLGNLRWLAGGLLISGSVVTAGVLVLANLPTLVGHGAAVTVVQADTATPAVLAQLRAAVAAGLQVRAVPSNLTPQPGAAANDTPASSRNGCHADFLVVSQGACVFGDPTGKHTAVLFGDSHMEQWLPAFDRAGARAGWRIVSWTKAACPPAQITVFAAQLNRTYSECDSWRSATLARIAALKPDLVFLSESDNVVPSSVPASALAADTISTLRMLASTTRAKVSFIDDIPVPNYDMPSCVAQHLSDARRCVFALRNAYLYPDRHAELAPAISRAGFAVIDPAPWICTATGCPAIVGNYLVYRNSTHLSASFSRWLTPMVAPLLRAKG